MGPSPFSLIGPDPFHLEGKAWLLVWLEPFFYISVEIVHRKKLAPLRNAQDHLRARVGAGHPTAPEMRNDLAPPSTGGADRLELARDGAS